MSSTNVVDAPLSFVLPPALEARGPAESRGITRDEVRLMVSRFDTDEVAHSRFTDLASHLRRGDLLVVNESATINASLPAQRRDGPARLHLSQRLPSGLWAVELRRGAPVGTRPLLDAEIGERVSLPAGGSAELVSPYGALRDDGGVRLWVARLSLPLDLDTYLDRYGRPISYGYVDEEWPLSTYQTVFAREPGSAEMPSAGRPFTSRVLHGLAIRGVSIGRVVLHAGVSSLEDHEPPYAEWFSVGAEVARLVNETRASGGRIVAVGTTVVRALESVASSDGYVERGEGWTDLIIGADRPLYAVDALLTGFHEPRASHLAMLEALAGRVHVETSYAAALDAGYLWHEFGDVHLLHAGA